MRRPAKPGRKPAKAKRGLTYDDVRELARKLPGVEENTQRLATKITRGESGSESQRA